MSLFAEVLRALDAGRPIALATVVAAGGSTPRHVGARMAVFADGTAHDTIGGGRIELAVTQAGQAVAAGAPATRVRHHLVRDLAMCCGGWMDVVVAPAASVVPLRVSASVVHLSFSRVVAAIDYAIESGCHVISMSLGAPTPSPATPARPTSTNPAWAIDE